MNSVKGNQRQHGKTQDPFYNMIQKCVMPHLMSEDEHQFPLI